MRDQALRNIALALIVAVAFVGGSTRPALAATSCTYNQSSSTGATFFATCETVNGNIVKFTSPATIQSIGGAIEGYGVCDYTNQLRYYDWGGGGNSAGKGTGFLGWKTPVLVSSSPLKISRTTADGELTLTQTFTRNNSDYILKITMTLVNHGAAKTIRLTRLANINANNTTNNDFIETADSVLGVAEGEHGMQIFNSSSACCSGGSRGVGAIGFTGQGPYLDPCVFNDSGPPPILNQDLMGWEGYVFDLGSAASKTVALEYRRF